MVITQEEIIAHTSGHFLTENFPRYWNTMPEATLLKFIEDHLWAELEHYEPHQMLTLITDTAYATKEFLEGKGAEVVPL